MLKRHRAPVCSQLLTRTEASVSSTRLNKHFFFVQLAAKTGGATTGAGGAGCGGGRMGGGGLEVTVSRCQKHSERRQVMMEPLLLLLLQSLK